MLYDLSKENDIYLFKKQVDWLLDKSHFCELIKKNKTRTISQNSALHLYFEMISKELNDMGITFNYTGLKGIELETPYTAVLVKETLWKPIQLTLFKKESTTQLTTQEMNDIISILDKFFAERGVYMPFPSIETLIEHEKAH